MTLIDKMQNLVEEIKIDAREMQIELNKPGVDLNQQAKIEIDFEERWMGTLDLHNLSKIRHIAKQEFKKEFQYFLDFWIEEIDIKNLDTIDNRRYKYDFEILDRYINLFKSKYEIYSDESKKRWRIFVRNQEELDSILSKIVYLLNYKRFNLMSLGWSFMDVITDKNYRKHKRGEKYGRYAIHNERDSSNIEK